MKKIALGSAIVAVAFLIAGCSSTPAPTPAPQPAPQAQAPAPVPYDPPVVSNNDINEQAFLTLIQSEFGSVDDATALRLGKAVCSALDSGAGLIQVGNIIIDNGFSASEAGTLVGASVAAFCPEYESDIASLT